MVPKSGLAITRPMLKSDVFTLARIFLPCILVVNCAVPALLLNIPCALRLPRIEEIEPL